MPLTEKGRKILASMRRQYGEDKGEQVFYASANAGSISGVHAKQRHAARKRAIGKVFKAHRRQKR